MNILELVMYMEIILPKTTRRRALDAYLHFAKATSASKVSADCTTWSYALLKALSHVVGQSELKRCVDEVKCGRGRSVIAGFGGLFRSSRAFEVVGWSHQSRQHRCGACGQTRVFRTVCYHCGTRASTKCITCPLWPVHDRRVPKKKLDVKIGDDPITLRVAKSETITRGLHYHRATFSDRILYNSFGGDQLFLAHKMYIALRRAAKIDASTYASVKREHWTWLRAETERWRKSHAVINEDMSMSDVLNLVEGLHVVSRVHAEERETSHSTSANRVSSARDGVRKRRRGDEEDVAFDAWMRRIKSGIEQFWSQHHITECLGYDPTDERGFPMTGANHCGLCAFDNLRYAHTCSKCGYELSKAVDWGALTDAMVWLYLFEDLHLDAQFLGSRNGYIETVSLEDVFKNHLLQSRHYFTIDEIGWNDWKLQCYFITHFLYVVSDWGTINLPRELFMEEFRFLANHLPYTVKLGDAEIVGEFLHCLRILGVSEDSNGGVHNDDEGDDTLRGAMRYAVKFMLLKEKQHRSKGLWVQERGTTCYDRYHSSYCGVVGLLSPISHHRSTTESSFRPPLFLKQQRAVHDPALSPRAKTRRVRDL